MIWTKHISFSSTTLILILHLTFVINCGLSWCSYRKLWSGSCRVCWARSYAPVVYAIHAVHNTISWSLWYNFNLTTQVLVATALPARMVKFYPHELYFNFDHVIFMSLHKIVWRLCCKAWAWLIVLGRYLATLFIIECDEILLPQCQNRLNRTSPVKMLICLIDS